MVVQGLSRRLSLTMHPVHRLEKLQRCAVRRATCLKRLIDVFPLPSGAELDRVTAFVTIEALSLWSSFARAYYLSCALNAKTVTGIRVTTSSGINTIPDAIKLSITHFRPYRKPPWSRKDEPTWHDTNTILTLARLIGASNLAQVQAALSYPTLVFTQLPVARNFFAHRNDDTARKTSNLARDLGLGTKLRPSVMLCQRALGRPQNVLADWLDDIRNVVELICQ